MKRPASTPSAAVADVPWSNLEDHDGGEHRPSSRRIQAWTRHLVHFCRYRVGALILCLLFLWIFIMLMVVSLFLGRFEGQQGAYTEYKLNNFEQSLNNFASNRCLEMVGELLPQMVELCAPSSAHREFRCSAEQQTSYPTSICFGTNVMISLDVLDANVRLQTAGKPLEEAIHLACKTNANHPAIDAFSTQLHHQIEFGVNPEVRCDDVLTVVLRASPTHDIRYSLSMMRIVQKLQEDHFHGSQMRIIFIGGDRSIRFGTLWKTMFGESFVLHARSAVDKHSCFTNVIFVSPQINYGLFDDTFLDATLSCGVAKRHITAFAQRLQSAVLPVAPSVPSSALGSSRFSVGVFIDDCPVNRVSCGVWGDADQLLRRLQAKPRDGVNFVLYRGTDMTAWAQATALNLMDLVVVGPGHSSALAALMAKESTDILEIVPDRQRYSSIYSASSQRNISRIRGVGHQQFYIRSEHGQGKVVNAIEDFVELRNLVAGATRSDSNKLMFTLPKTLPDEVVALRGRTRDPNNPRLAVIVAFGRGSKYSQGIDRLPNLKQFAAYMNDFLTRAGRDYEIVVVEQEDGPVFNKGALFNAGYQFVRNDFDYICLHDVDQLPEKIENDYSMPDKPTHLCSAPSMYGYKLLYDRMVGGAIITSNADWEKFNGFSNKYWGWGGEDDDLFVRIVRHFGRPGRIDPKIGRYTSIDHQRVKDLDTTPLFAQGRRRLEEMKNPAFDYSDDGFDTVQFHTKEVIRSPLNFTWYTIGLDFAYQPWTLDEVENTE